MARLRHLRKAGWGVVKVESNIINTFQLRDWCDKHAEMPVQISYDGSCARVAFASMFDLMKFTAEWETT